MDINDLVCPKCGRKGKENINIYIKKATVIDTVYEFNGDKYQWNTNVDFYDYHFDENDIAVKTELVCNKCYTTLYELTEEELETLYKDYIE